LADFFGVWGARCQVIISSRRAVYSFLKKAQRAVRCSSFSAKPSKSAAISVSAVFTYNSSASLARFIQSSACRRYSFDVGIAALRLCPTSPKVIWFPRGPSRTLQVSEGPRREAGDRGGLGELTDSRVGRSLDEAFFSRNVGRFVLGFKCEPVQVRDNVEQNVLHSHVGCTLGHLTAFSGAISASFRCKHNAPRGSIASKCPKAKPRRGGPAGLKLGRICGSGLGGVPAKSTFQVSISVNRSKEFRPCLLSLLCERCFAGGPAQGGPG